MMRIKYRDKETKSSTGIAQRLGTMLAACLLSVTLWGQTSFSEPTKVFLMHSSGNHLEMGTDGGGWIESSTKSDAQQMTFIPVGEGYYNIQAGDEPVFLSFASPWNSKFISDASGDEAKFAIEEASGQLVKLRCKSNGRYLGTDSNDGHSKVFTDKSGSDIKHQWYFGSKVNDTPPAIESRYMVNPLVVRQHFDGWGVSLCWWAGQCGKWSDEKIDEIITWLVSPTGLNYSHFRYNIGGGDDPENRHCNLHHMGYGKGLRAEMEGFKDSSDDEYHWERDAAQRKIMLKIKEKRPDAVFEAFSNSCPYYMTYSGCVSGSVDGGTDNLRPEYYEEFAHYLVDVCKHYKDEYGIEFKTLEPFNESVTGFWYANGAQEGCHFDYESQIEFVRVLAPILKASGLNTVIAAADETNVGLAVEGFKRFIEADADQYVGQWNTHTYSGSNVDRARFSQLAHETGKDLWMSETGSGGNGIGGNLSMAQRLIDDMRYIQPDAWIDWQYMEEANDQWCTIRGDFAKQTYYKVKNYYVRQQCSRFIKRGYDIITSLCPQSLAAVNAARDTLVIVALNEGSATTHYIDLSLFQDLPTRSRIRAYRTSETEELTNALGSVKIDGSNLTLKLPAQSITTVVIPARAMKVEAQALLHDGGEYLIVPRQETARAITATDSKVTVEDVDYGDAQRWTLTDKGNGTYSFHNALGLRLTAHRNSNSSSLTAQKNQSSEQNFRIESIDFANYKILCANHPTYAFDLSNASSNAGTTVGTWLYADGTTTPTHRQWMLFPLTTPQVPDCIEDVQTDATRSQTVTNLNIYDLTGRRVASDNTGKANLAKGIYIMNGKKVVIP
ncbi:MAG: RICIN domain-containing protein [Bacteroidaceae bacterium]|nr:RICIN domain-containing protein [Bacteroidaceae bacterium]